MSSEDVLTSRLADLESDAFHLKLRNYYLERRVSRSLHGAENSEEQLVKLLEDAPEVSQSSGREGRRDGDARRRRRGDSSDDDDGGGAARRGGAGRRRDELRSPRRDEPRSPRSRSRGEWRGPRDGGDRSRVRALESKLGRAEDALERERKKRTAAEVALEILRSERSVAEGRVPEEAARELRALRDEVAEMTRRLAESDAAAGAAAARAAAAEDATRAALRARDDAEAAAAAERRTAEELVAFEAEQIAALEEEAALLRRERDAAADRAADALSRAGPPRDDARGDVPRIAAAPAAATVGTPATARLREQIDALSFLPAARAPAPPVVVVKESDADARRAAGDALRAVEALATEVRGGAANG